MNEMKKPYNVKVEFEFVVIAKDNDNALKVAEDSFTDVMSDTDLFSLLDESCISETTFYPEGWNEYCIPYGGDGTSPLGAYLEKTLVYTKAKNKI